MGRDDTGPSGFGGASLTFTPATAGNFTVVGGQNEWQAGFSLNPSAAESMLGRVPADQIEALLGQGSVIPVGREVKLREVLNDRFPQPVELFPLLMLILLFVLAIENLLANRFYRTTGAKQV